MITSKLSSRSQTIIPPQVRAALRLRAGDAIAYAIKPGGKVVLTRVRLTGEPFATFGE